MTKKQTTRILFSALIALAVLASIMSVLQNDAQAAVQSLHFLARQRGSSVPVEGAKPDPTATSLPATAMQVAFQSGEDPESYPGPATQEGITSPDTGQTAYPSGSETLAPPTPVIVSTAGYPLAPVSPNDIVNGTRIPNIGLRNQEPVGGQSDSEQQASTQPLLGTLFLWLGFMASFIVFISGVAGAIYYYGRRQDRSG